VPIDFERIGDNIKRVRKEQGLTQTALAAKMGCTEQHISQLERGKGKAQLPFMNALCEMWRVPLAAFLEGALTVPLNWEEGMEDSETERIKREIVDLLDGCTAEQMRHIYEIMKPIRRYMK